MSIAKKYHRLLSGDNNLLSNERYINNKDIIIAEINNNIRKYSVIDPSDLSLYDSSCNLHEIILEDVDRRLMLDIDCDDMNINKEDLLNNITRAVWNYFCLHGYSVDWLIDFKVMSRHRSNKISWHILYENLYCINSNHMKYVMNGIYELVDDKYKKYFDTCIANRNSSMSIAGYTNKEYKMVVSYDNRFVLVQSFINDLIYGNKVIDLGKCKDSYDSKDLLITYFDKEECFLMPGWDKRLKNNKINCDIENDKVKEMIDIAIKKIPNIMSAFELRHNNQTWGRFINLDRIEPSHCLACDKTHDNDNSLMLLMEDKGLFWLCRKDKNKTKHLIECFNVEKKKQKNKFEEQVNNILSLDNKLSRQDVLTGEEKYNEIYIREFKEFSNVLCIKSAKGTGKTYALRKYIRSLDKGKRVGCISFRKTLTTSLVNMLNADDVNNDKNVEVNVNNINNNNKNKKINNDKFVNYQYVEGVITDNRWVCQLESLLRIVKCEMDLLVIDEFNQVISQMLSVSGNRINSIFARFEYMIRSAKKIIVMDADLTNESIDILKRLRGDGEYNIIHNYYTKSYELKITDDKKKTKEYIAKKLRSGEKVCIATNHGAKFALTLAHQLENINNYVTKINKKVKPTKKKILVICKDTLDEVGYTLKDVNKYWINYDCVIYSPSVQSGVSFDVPNYFDCVVGFFCNTSCNYTDCSQMMHRVRHTKERIVCVKTTNIPYAPGRTEEMEKYITIIRQSTLNIPYEETANGYSYPLKNNYYHIWISKECEKNRSRQNFLYLFMRAEACQGANIIYWNTDSIFKRNKTMINNKIADDDVVVNDVNNVVDSMNKIINVNNVVDDVVDKIDNVVNVNKIKEREDNIKETYINIKDIINKITISNDKFNKAEIKAKEYAKKYLQQKLLNDNAKCKYIARTYNMDINVRYPDQWYITYSDDKISSAYKGLCAIENGLDKLREREIKYYNHAIKNNIVSEVSNKYYYKKHQIAQDILKLMKFDNVYDDKKRSAKTYFKKVQQQINNYIESNWKVIKVFFNVRNKTFIKFDDLKPLLNSINGILFNLYGVKIKANKKGKNIVESYSLHHKYYKKLFSKKKNKKNLPIIKYKTNKETTYFEKDEIPIDEYLAQLDK